MSNQKRMALSLKPEARAAIFDLADALEQPASTVVSTLLLEMAPQLHDLAKIARHTKNGKKSAAKRALVHMMGDTMGALMAEQLPLRGVKK